ncbi:hypothetical protein BpHYR1_009850 [Brachionus plicatilis]|uniref:Uncharacterized protein n=1 Tax=Brachionus plicatilis TaxID=10195 RepID=A0A3M7SV73_BRAPC|nr:hypothetical protein BpHYR1_009850 [Brachionus plicatilis]
MIHSLDFPSLDILGLTFSNIEYLSLNKAFNIYSTTMTFRKIGISAFYDLIPQNISKKFNQKNKTFVYLLKKNISNFIGYIIDRFYY